KREQAPRTPYASRGSVALLPACAIWIARLFRISTFGFRIFNGTLSRTYVGKIQHLPAASAARWNGWGKCLVGKRRGNCPTYDTERRLLRRRRREGVQP